MTDPIFPIERPVDASIENIGGWTDQYARVLRWKARFDDCRERGRYPNHADFTVEHLDLLVCFFIHCYSLRDWLIESGVATKAEMKAFVNQSVHLRLCADICNRSKHQKLTWPKEKPGLIDKHFYIRYEPNGKLNNLSITVHYRLQTPGPFTKIDSHDLADGCLTDWQFFMTTKGLS